MVGPGADGAIGADVWPSAAPGASTDATPANVAPPKNARRSRPDDRSRSVMMSPSRKRYCRDCPGVRRVSLSSAFASTRVWLRFVVDRRHAADRVRATVRPPQLFAAGPRGLKYWLIHRRSELRTSCNPRSWIPTFRASAEWRNSALIATLIAGFHA